jgi:PKD repeat protein
MKTTFFFLSVLFLFASCNNDNEVRQLKAEFALGDTLLAAGQILDVKNTSDSISVISNWDFGDGFTTDERNPIHYYLEPGVYNIELKISDKLGNEKNITRKVRVGERFIYEIELINIKDHKYFSTTDYWDEDSVGVNALPDVYFLITGFNNTTPLFETKTINNVSQRNLPINFQIPDVKIRPFNNYETDFGICLRDRDLNNYEDVTNNKMSGTSFSGSSYNRIRHSGEFTVGFFGSRFKVKYKIK